MKIVHTADVHLSQDHPERLEALKKVLEACEDEEADILLIAGDLFDDNVDVETLKTDLRPLFEDNSFKTYVIPGNHDNTAFRKEDYFGEDIEILSNTPYETEEFEDFRLISLPYTEKDFSELMEELPEPGTKTDILMIHCTLSGTQGGFGEEKRYMPVKPAQIVQTGFNYILSGHIHSSATRKTFGDTTFAYSGSPVSISSSETGRRAVWIIDTEKEEMKARQLDTEYFLQRAIELMPGNEEEELEGLVSDLKDRDLEKANIRIEITGFTEQEVKQIIDDFSEELQKLEPLSLEINSDKLEAAGSIVQTDIYTEFEDKLEEKNVENPEDVKRNFLRGLSRYER